MRTRDELIWALSARMSLFQATFDRDAVLAPEALGLALALIRSVPDPSRDRDAVATVAEYYALRALLLDGEASGPDAAIARALTRLAAGRAETGLAPPAGPEAPGAAGRMIAAERQAAELLELAERDPDPRALDEAVRTARAAVDATPAGLLIYRAPALAGLGIALRLRYERSGSLADLHAAVGALREAELASVSVHPQRARIISALGVTLRIRYERAGAQADLDESIRLARQAVDATPADDFNHGGRLSNLSVALRLRYERLGTEPDLDEAIAIGRAAVAALPPGHHGYAQVRTGLRNALVERYQQRGDPKDLTDAAALDEQAVEATPAGSDLRPGLLLNLASSLTRRYEAAGAAADGDRAEALLREAIAALPAGHSQLAVMHYQLGLVAWARHRHTGAQPDLDTAVACASTAALQQAAAPTIRLQSAVAWGQWAMAAGDPLLAMAGYGQAIELLPAITPRNLARGDAEHALTRFPGLACDAAASALQAGDAERAVALLEQGRGVLLAHLLPGRDEVAELREQAPELARLLELRAVLDADVTTENRAGTSAMTADGRHVVASDWDRLLAQIRALPGFAGFFRPPPLTRLLEQAAAGPVVLVNVSRHRCDALLLTVGGLRVVPLPDLTIEAVIEQAVGFQTVLEQLEDPAAVYAAGQQLQEALSTTLGWLWDTVAGPVLDALGITGPPHTRSGWPRVWWIPTGPLAFLPVHAAARHPAADGRSVLDRVVSSYAPTVRTLAHARRAASGGPGTFLIVAVPEAPGASPLPGAAAEAAALAALLPGARVLQGTEATSDAVLAGIGERNWLHFAGHGYADPVSPSQSQLIVHDHAERPLTVTAISRLRLEVAELAYLSACSTARTGFGLADEALHLAAGLQLAGYRHVVGTLWPIDDAMALHIAKRVYAALGAPAPRADLAADAVHAAVREARDEHPSAPSRWAAYIHVGA